MSVRREQDRRGGSISRITGALLVIAALLALGWVIGRATAPAAAPPSPGAPETSEAQAPAGPGPERLEAGVPVGYAHTEAGAVSAASQYTAALGSELLLDPDARAAAIDRIAVPDGRADLERLADTADLFANRLNLTPDLLDDPAFVYRTYPIGWRVTSYSDDEAVVAVWNTGLFVAPGREAFTSPYNTATYTLRWADEDWRVAGLSTADGPTPPLGQASDSGLIGEEINGFQRYRYLPGE